MTTQRYATDLTDAEWALIEPLLPAPAHTGRPRQHAWRILLNAIFYQLRTGGAWRFLPQEWPPWQTVYHYFRLLRLNGTWERFTRRCVSGCGDDWDAILSRAPAASTASR